MTWVKCPWKRKVIYDGIEQEDGTVKRPPHQESIHLNFGKIIHELVGFKLQNNVEGTKQLLLEHQNNKKFIEMYEDIGDGADKLAEYVKKKEWKLIETELPISSTINFKEMEQVTKRYKVDKNILPVTFNGYIDFIFEDKTGKHIIIDLKVCGWYYTKQIKEQCSMQYQIALYKHFYASEKNVPLDNVSQGFFFILKKNRTKFEPYMITCTNYKIRNALIELYKCYFSILGKTFFKDQSHCQWCYLRNTEFCTKT